MKLLVDTHAYIWWGVDPVKLSTRAAAASLAKPESEIYVSAASLWEIMIKSQLGKLTSPPSPRQVFAARLREENLVQNPAASWRLTWTRTRHLGAFHRDPFDRTTGVAQSPGGGARAPDERSPDSRLRHSHLVVITPPAPAATAPRARRSARG